MKLLAVGRPREGAGVGEIARYARAEMSALWQLYRDEVVREMYSPAQPERSWCLRRRPDRSKAALDGLPLAAAGLIVFEVIELHPFGALEVLFADGRPR